MIYQFRSKAGPDVIMLADLTKRIFDILGRPMEPRGILTVEQLPDLITALETAIHATSRTSEMFTSSSGLGSGAG